MVMEKDKVDNAELDGATSPDGSLNETPDNEPGEEEEQITLSKKELNDRLSKAGVETGRALKAALEANTTLKSQYDQTNKSVEELNTLVANLRKAQREKEIADARGDKGVVDSLTLRHQAEDAMEEVRKTRSELERDKAQHQADIEAAARAKAEVEARELAKTCGLTADLLVEIATDTASNGQKTYNIDRMKSIAKSVPKGDDDEDGSGDDETGDQPGNRVKGQQAAAKGARNRGGGKALSTMADYDKAYVEGKITAEEYGKARTRFGVA